MHLHSAGFYVDASEVSGFLNSLFVPSYFNLPREARIITNPDFLCPGMGVRRLKASSGRAAQQDLHGQISPSHFWLFNSSDMVFASPL